MSFCPFVSRGTVFCILMHGLVTIRAMPGMAQPCKIEWGRCYPPKLSYMRFSDGTPRSQSIFSTALLIGPGPHM